MASTRAVVAAGPRRLRQAPPLTAGVRRSNYRRTRLHHHVRQTDAAAQVFNNPHVAARTPRTPRARLTGIACDGSAGPR